MVRHNEPQCRNMRAGAIATPAGWGSGAFLSVTLVLFMARGQFVMLHEEAAGYREGYSLTKAPLLPFCTCRLTSWLDIRNRKRLRPRISMSLVDARTVSVPTVAPQP